MLTMHMDPSNSSESGQVGVEIARIDKDENGTEIQTTVHTELFGPPNDEDRKTFKEKVVVDWDDPGNHHAIKTYSQLGNPISFTLAAQKQNPLSKHSVLIAALIMVAVYIFILIEVIHRK